MQIVEITDSNSEQLKFYFSLSESELRRESLFIAESPHVIERALMAGIEPVSMLCDKEKLNAYGSSLLPCYPGVPVYTANKEMLARITGFSLSRGILCLMKRPSPIASTEIIRNARRLCVIYDVCDAVNTGIIFRSAAALGYDGIILSERSCDPLNRRSTRVSMGGVFQIPWCRTSDVTGLLHEYGFSTVSTALSPGCIPLNTFTVNPSEKYAIIFGSEGYGLPPEVLVNCDFSVVIPMKEGVDSLNVGAAAAIVLWHFRNFQPIC